MRRKQAEELMAWKKKLDEEEMRVKEIEKKAKSMVVSKSRPEDMPAFTLTPTPEPAPAPVPLARKLQEASKQAISHTPHDLDNSYDADTFVSAPTSSQIHTDNRMQQAKSTADSESIQTQIERKSSQSIRENIVTESSTSTESSSSASSTSSISEMIKSTHSNKDLEFKVCLMKNVCFTNLF